VRDLSNSPTDFLAYYTDMSWLKLALGLIREAAGTDVGQEMINNMRSSARKESPSSGPQHLDVKTLLAEHRIEIDRNFEVVVARLNEQQAQIQAAIRRQRMWNLALAVGLLAALIAALVTIK
jgi:hypothetical protein